MRILIVNPGIIPVTLYGGTERVIWYLGKELVKMGHEVTYLVAQGSSCDFAQVLHIDGSKKISEQIHKAVDIIHLNYHPQDVEDISNPHVVTAHGNWDYPKFDKNTIFVSRNHADRYGSDSYVYNGLDWDDYSQPDYSTKRDYFHFLGNAAWRVKNVQGAIDVIKRTKREKLKVMGGNRMNVKMGFRLTTSPRVSFYGMVGGKKKYQMINDSKGLIFPVKWHEPFGLAIIESLYYGCPVFGTPYGSLPELVTPETGYLSSSAASLADAIENSSKYSHKGCHDYAIENFNSKKMAESYLKKYEQVLEGESLNTEAPKIKDRQFEKFIEWTK